MTVQASWDDTAETILRFDFSGAWTWDEFDSAMTQASALRQGSSGRFDVMNAIHAGARPPEGVMIRIRDVMMHHSPELGLVIIVNGGLAVDTLVAMFRRLFPGLSENWRTAPTVEVGRAIIQADRTSSSKG